jgi:predicted nucleotidyltransferase
MEKIILKSLVYADIFDYPLNEKEATERLIVEERQVPANIEKSLDDLVEEGVVEKLGEYFFLPGRKEIVKLRQKREKFSQEKMEIADRAAKFIKLIPTVKFVGVTGSVAAGNAEKGDDIDFFIISASGWLWTTRFLVTLILDLIGKRRRPDDKETKDKICLNLFVDETSLDVFDHNLFTAYELFQLKPLVDKNNIYQKLIAANSWVKSYLPNVPKFRILDNLGSDNSSRSRTIVDKVLMSVQIWWMRNRQTTEITERYLIAFHPKDISQQVMIKYKRQLKKYA